MAVRRCRFHSGTTVSELRAPVRYGFCFQGTDVSENLPIQASALMQCFSGKKVKSRERDEPAHVSCGGQQRGREKLLLVGGLHTSTIFYEPTPVLE